MAIPSNKEIIAFLASGQINAGFIDMLKVRYRPLICPFDKLLSYAENSNSVFDIGCGSGQFCSLVAKFTRAKRIHGVEISSRLIQNARQLNTSFSGEKEMVFEEFNGKELPARIVEFETVFMIDVLHHIPAMQQQPFINQLSGKMKTGTTLVLKDINAAHPFVLFNKIHDLLFSGEIGNEVSRKRARQMLEQAGFTVKDDFTQTVLAYPHFFLIAQK